MSKLTIDINTNNYVLEKCDNIIVDEKSIIHSNILNLTNWFNAYFDKQLTQSMWQDDFTVSHDDYFDKDYANIDELKAQAEIVRREIKQLKENL